ncbi:diamine acetyltransferase 2-like [Strongylocentrotus purpuratus]|uniref:N-acetyltransferase domain-containing protein n=1 Tax=Strongylocentrotus purpuratus TaxID=7668 RepID=A0A7M7N075_STRPU|nr:diamine acetyltransferase 2-like [Strongylocentrotus purpuratus]
MMAAKPETIQASYVVRRGRREDCDELLRLIWELADHEGTLQKPTITKEILLEDAFGERPNLHFFVVELKGLEDNGDIRGKMCVGFAAMNGFVTDIFLGRHSKLCGLYIDEGHRGNGLGRALMKAVCKTCLDLGVASLDFDVRMNNQRARHFYSSLGVTNNTETKGWEYWQFRDTNMKKFSSEPECLNGVNTQL